MMSLSRLNINEQRVVKLSKMAPMYQYGFVKLVSFKAGKRNKLCR